MAGELEDSTMMLQGIIAFQALYRGYRTRKAMLAVRDEFNSIFAEIEKQESQVFDIIWHPHYVISRPSIKPETSEISIDKKGSYKHELEDISEKITTGYSEPFSIGGRTNTDVSDIEAGRKLEQCDSLPSIDLPESNLNIEHEQPEKAETVQQLSVENCEDALDKDLMASRDSFSDSLLQPAAQKSDGHSEELGQGVALDGTGQHRRNSQPDRGDEDILQALNVNSLRLLTREGLFQKEKDIQMELIWIQQAIESRKQYLKLKR